MIAATPPQALPSTSLWPRLLQHRPRIGRERHRLDEDLVGQPLVMDARRVDRLLHVHAVVDDVEDRLDRDRDDARAAWAADHHEQLAVLRDDGRAHRGQRPLARRDGILLALHQAEHVRRARLGGEVVHLVVEEEAGVAGDHLGAEQRVDRVGHRHRVAVLVDDRIMRRLGAFMRRASRAARPSTSPPCRQSIVARIAAA